MSLPTRPRSEDELSRWSRLEGLLELAERGLGSFEPDQLRELALLYRQATVDLARHQRLRTTGPTLGYLHALVARGRRVIYVRPPQTIRWAGLWDVIARDFPRAVRAEWRLLALAAALTFIPSIAGYVAMGRDPAWVRALFPDLFVMMESGGYGSQETPGALATAIEEGSYASASAMIAANNIRVSIICYGFGITFGLGTLYALMMNGTLLGAVGYFYLSRGPEFREYFYAGILPHGVWELTAICLSGAAGLMLARAMLFPGELPRTEALRRAAPGTLPLVGGVILMLLVAGLIEGFITPSRDLAPMTKMLVGIGSGVLFWIYIAFAGHPRPAR